MFALDNRRRGRRGAWSIRPLGWVPFVGVVIFLGHQRARAQSPATTVRQVSGLTQHVAVPMVSEPWVATQALVPPPVERQVRFIGHYPGFRAAKQKANQAALQRLSGRHFSAVGKAFTLFPQAATSSTLVFNGPSESDTSIIPPDPQVAAGPTQVVVAVNALLAIYDKTGVLQGSFQHLSSFFSSLGVTGQISDPRIIYDQTDGRFILTADDVDFTNFTSGVVLLAVSQTSDATGVWNKYAINFKGRNLSNTSDTFPDFPTLGLSSSAIYISTGQFTINLNCLQADTCSFSDAWIKVIGLPALLSGSSTLNITTFRDVQTTAGLSAFAIEPAVSYGTPAAEFLAAADFSAEPNDALDLFSISLSGTPMLQTTTFTVPSYALPPDAEQPGFGALIFTDDFRLLNAVWSGGSLWCGHNVADDTGSNSVARWYQIQLTDLTSASLTQSGSVSGAGAAYFPAISIKADGTAGMVFTTSSDSVYASAAFTAREPGDSPGTMRSFGILQAGTGIYDESRYPNRWGDYSGISEDPDGQTFWGIAELAGTPNLNAHFETAIAEIAGPPELSVSPGSVDFGNVLEGSAATPQTVTLTNIGATSITLSSLAISGANASDFSLASDGCSNVTLGASQTCTVSVSFKPSLQAPEDALLSIPYAGNGGLITVGLSGTGVMEAILTFSPASLTFPATVQQGASAPQVVAMKNTGNTAAEISNTSVPLDFTQTNTCGSSLAPGASCQFSVVFRPISSGLFQGFLSVSSNAPGPNGIPLSGTAITAPAVVLCPPSVSFSSQTVNTTSATQTVILTNTGSEQLTITGITVSGDFAQTSNCLASLAPRAACAINATFTPTATGTRSGSISIYDDASGSPQVVSLSGTGSATTASLRDMLPLLITREGRELGKILASRSRAVAHREAGKKLTGYPLFFEPNEGQFDSGVAFGGRFPGYNLAISTTSLTLELAPQLPGKVSSVRALSRANTKSKTQRPTNLTMSLVGANPGAHAVAGGELPGKVNYFIGRDPEKWRTNVPTYARVALQGVYPGINLSYYGSQRQLEYDFVVAPGADPRNIRLAFGGASRVRLDGSGDLFLTTADGEIRLHKPIVYQPLESGRPAVVSGRSRVATESGQQSADNRQSAIGNRKFLNGRYVLLASNQIAFRVGPYDAGKPLVIDPVLSFSTYLGGSGGDEADAIAVDSSGNVYVAGRTASVDFPVTSDAFQKACGTAQIPCNASGGIDFFDAFIAKFSSDGSTLLYATYLGGTAPSGGGANGIAADSLGNAYIVGTTSSGDFPTTAGSFQPNCTIAAGSIDSCYGTAFVTKLNPTGSSLVYSTYLGGSPAPNEFAITLPDAANGIALDSVGEAYIVGLAGTPNFPTTPGAFQTTGPRPGGTIGFLTKLNGAGSGLVFSTYFGGSSGDQLNTIAVDGSGNAYVAGMSSSLDFPTTPGAFQTGYYGTSDTEFAPIGDGVVAKFSPSGKLLYSTYLSGANGSDISSIAVDGAGAAYVTGQTFQGGFPVTVGGYNSSLPPYPAFVAKLHPDGCALPYSAYLNLPGYYDSEGRAISLDASGDIYVAGSLNDYAGVPPIPFPGVEALQPPLGGSPAFVTELDPSGSTALFSTPLGGSVRDAVRSIALGPDGEIYLAGATASYDFPAVNAWQSANPTPPNSNAFLPTTGFVAKVSPGEASGVFLTRTSLTYAPQAVGFVSLQNQAVGLMNHLSTPLGISSVTLSGSGFSLQPTPFPCSGSIAPGAGCSVAIQFAPTFTGPVTGTLTITDDGPGSPRTVTLNGMGLADFILEMSGQPTPNPIIAGDSSVQYTIGGSGISGATAPTGDIALSCSGVSPAACTFNPTTVTAFPGTTSTLTVNNIAAVGDTPLNFSVVGTLGTQTYSLPLSLAVEDFSLGVSPGSASVTPGQSGTYTLTISPINGFSQGVSFGCSGLPSLATCTFSPPSQGLDGTRAATVKLTVTTTAPSLTLPRPPSIFPLAGHPMESLPWWIALLMLLATMVALWRRLGVTATRGILAACLLFVLLWAACGGGGSPSGGGGGGNPGTPQGTYTLTIKAVSSSLSHDTTVTLVVD